MFNIKKGKLDNDQEMAQSERSIQYNPMLSINLYLDAYNAYNVFYISFVFKSKFWKQLVLILQYIN